MPSAAAESSSPWIDIIAAEVAAVSGFSRYDLQASSSVVKRVSTWPERLGARVTSPINKLKIRKVTKHVQTLWQLFGPKIQIHK